MFLTDDCWIIVPLIKSETLWYNIIKSELQNNSITLQFNSNINWNSCYIPASLESTVKSLITLHVPAVRPLPYARTLDALPISLSLTWMVNGEFGIGLPCFRTVTRWSPASRGVNAIPGKSSSANFENKCQYDLHNTIYYWVCFPEELRVRVH